MSIAETTSPGIFGVIAKWWQHWKAREAAVSELASCGADETAHLARDIGVGVAELETLAGRWPGSSELLDQRMGAIGLGAEQIAHSDPEVVRDLQRVCGQCGSESRCARDLDRDKEDQSWRDYCPNVATLDALRRAERDRRLMRRRKWKSTEYTLPPCC